MPPSTDHHDDKNLNDNDVVDYGLEDLHSDDSTDEEDYPRKPIPPWAQASNLIPAVQNQEKRLLNDSMKVFARGADSVDLEKIFETKRGYYYKRTSSAQWSSPPANNH